MDTRTALSNRPLNNLGCVTQTAPVKMILRCTVIRLIYMTPFPWGQVALCSAWLLTFNTNEAKVLLFISEIKLENCWLQHAK